MWRALFLAVLAAGCTKPSKSFVCAGNAPCVLDGEQGTCEETGFCSFPDPSCDSERRYGTATGADLADRCVEPAGPHLGPWEPGNAFDERRRNHTTALHGGRVYLIGGRGAEVEVTRVQIGRLEVGDVASWEEGRPLPKPRRSHVSFAHDGFLYVAGGTGPSSFSSSIASSAIAEDGTLGPWNEVRPLPAGRRAHGAALVGDWIYVVGGKVSSSESSDEVFSARLGDGEVGSWQQVGPLDGPRHGHAVATDGKHLFVIGGCRLGNISCDDTYADVQVADIEDDGGLGPFRATTPLPTGRRDLAATVAGGRLVVVAGLLGDGSFVGLAETAFIHPDGSLAPWEDAPPIEEGRRRPRLEVHEGYLYHFGGSFPRVQLSELR